jgi:hypothetical protein
MFLTAHFVQNYEHMLMTHQQFLAHNNQDVKMQLVLQPTEVSKGAARLQHLIDDAKASQTANASQDAKPIQRAKLGLAALIERASKRGSATNATASALEGTIRMKGGENAASDSTAKVNGVHALAPTQRAQRQKQELTDLQKRSKCAIVPADDQLRLPKPDKTDISAPAMLFLDRLEHYLPRKEFLTAEDVAAVEGKITTFQIPYPLKVQIQSSYLPAAFSVWMEANPGMCPNCEVFDHVSPRDSSQEQSETVVDSDIIVDIGCPTSRPHSKSAKVVCGCGESRIGTGKKYWDHGLPQCDYSMSTYREPQYYKGPADPHDTMRYTYNSLHLAPQCANATTIAKQMSLMLRIPTKGGPFEKPEAAPLAFVHHDCNARSGRDQIIQMLIRRDDKSVDRWGSCFNNGRNSIKEGVEPSARKDWHWHDSTANRDVTKTIIGHRYHFLASLENTHDVWYFTEKRFEAMTAGSIPLVFRNHHSEMFTPSGNESVYFYQEGADPNYVNPEGRAEAVEQLHDTLVAVASDDAAMMKYHSWKQRGMRRAFVKELFRGRNFVPCRLCELFAHGLLNRSTKHG